MMLFGTGSEVYIARHYYQAEDENQLTLETGRIVEVVEKMDNGWWRGQTGDQQGWFPATFVKKVDGEWDLCVECLLTYSIVHKEMKVKYDVFTSRYRYILPFSSNIFYSRIDISEMIEIHFCS